MKRALRIASLSLTVPLAAGAVAFSAPGAALVAAPAAHHASVSHTGPKMVYDVRLSGRIWILKPGTKRMVYD